jgi:hypothetical protein
MFYAQFYPQSPQKRAFWINKREGVYPSLKAWSRWSGLNRRPAVYEVTARRFCLLGHLRTSVDIDRRLLRPNAEKRAGQAIKHTGG